MARLQVLNGYVLRDAASDAGITPDLNQYLSTDLTLPAPPPDDNSVLPPLDTTSGGSISPGSLTPPTLPTLPSLAPAIPSLMPSAPKKPFYKKGWFWAAAGGAAAVTGTAVVLTTRKRGRRR